MSEQFIDTDFVHSRTSYKEYRYKEKKEILILVGLKKNSKKYIGNVQI